MSKFKNILFPLFVLTFILSFGSFVKGQPAGDDQQVRAEADKLFAQQKYREAFPLYSQLLSIHRKDPYYSYRFGVCMLYTDRRDPEAPLKYLEHSVGQLSGEDAYMLYFHLGVAYHQAYRFGEALRAFEAFKGKVPAKSIYAKEAFIRNNMCINGINLLQNLSDLIVMKKSEVGIDNFFRSYDISKFGGRLGPKPDFLKSKLDKKSNEPEIVYINDIHNVVYYSSYGKKNDNGRDIYRVYKLPTGKYSEPERLSSAVNTPYDENYPYLLPDGKTLYFCSKGHNSMGGYDIFRTVYDSTLGDWTPPVNVDFAINTPFDDILFITDPSQRYAWFSSNRNSSDGKIMVFLVRIDRKIDEFDDYNPQMITADNIDNSSSEYLNTISLLRQKARLDVNSDEEMQLDTDTLTAFNNNEKYNIPKNPTGEQIVDIAFGHVKSAVNQLNDFKNMRDASLKISEIKKDKAEALNKESSQLYDKALKETDNKKRKELLAQSNELSKKSSQLFDESELAKKMYVQYANAADNQSVNLDKIHEEAGNVQKLALSRQIDTSVVLLKKLIDGVDTFKINLVQLDKKIRGDNEYISELEQIASNANAESKKLADDAKKLDKDAEIYSHEAALTNDSELKQEYQAEADKIKQEADEKRLKSEQLKKLAQQKQAELSELKSKSGLQQEVINSTLAYLDSVNNAEISQNQLLADNNLNSDNNNINSNNSDSNNNDVTDINNIPNQNQINTNQTIETNTDVVIANNNNNSNNNSNNNNEDVKHPVNVVANNDIDANTTEKLSTEILQNIDSDLAFVHDKIERNLHEADAVNLSFSKKKNEYDFIYSQWNSLSSKSDLSQAEQSKKLKYESDMSELYIQMSVLSDFYNEIANNNALLTQAEEDIKSLKAKISDGSVTDSLELKSILAESKGIVETLSKAPDYSIKEQEINTRLSSIRNKISESEKIRNSTLAQANTIEGKIKDLQDKYESTNNPKKRSQISKNISNNQEKLKLLTEQINAENKKIISLNDSAIYIEKHNQMLSDVRSTYALIPDNEIKSMSETWNKTAQKHDINNIGRLPDFEQYAELNNANSNVNQNTAADNTESDTVAALTKNIKIDDDEQDLLQSSFYRNGAETFLARIASLKKKVLENPADSANINKEIAALGHTMRAYSAEADAYENNAINNYKLIGKQPPAQLHAYTEETIIEFHQRMYEISIFKSDSLKRLAEASNEPDIKNRLLKQAADYEESAKRHYLMANDLYGIWNNSQFETNNIALTEYNLDGTNDNKNAYLLMIEARQLRSKAFSERDFVKQREIISLAQEKEKQAIEIQKAILSSNNIENPQKIAKLVILQIEETCNQDIAEIAKIYTSNTNILSNFEKSLSSDKPLADNQNNTIQDNNLDNSDVNSNIVVENITNTNNNNIANTTENTNNNDIALNNNLSNTINNNNNSNTDNTAANIITNNNTGQPDNRNESSRLYYRIQIAASRAEVDTARFFRGMNVLIDKTGAWNQYMTGYFTSYNIANADLRRVRQMGYADAFVVAYYDGKRVPVYEARNIEQNSGLATVEHGNVPIDNIKMNEIEDLVYSVQVGVYATTRNSSTLFGISPLIEERMANGYYRYYAGTFDNMNDAVAARNRIRTAGVPDAFVVILHKGKKISQAEANDLIAKGARFGKGIEQNNTTTQVQGNENQTANTMPLSKPVFKVQIGAYSKDVPVNVVNELIALAGQGIETNKNDAGLTVYMVGNFDKYSDAEIKKNELNSKGLGDAFVVAFIDGKRVSINEARAASDGVH